MVAPPRRIKEIWDISTQEVYLLGAHEDLPSITVTEQGKRFACALRNNVFVVQEANNVRDLRPQHGHTDRVNTVAFTPDGSQALSASLDGEVKVWDVATRQVLYALPFEILGASDIAVTPDGTIAVITSYSGRDESIKIKFWELTRREEFRIPTQEKVSPSYAVDVTGDGRYIVLATVHDTVEIHGLYDAAPPVTFHGHDRRVTDVMVAPNGNTIIDASHDGSMKFWRWKTEPDYRSQLVSRANETRSLGLLKRIEKKSGTQNTPATPRGEYSPDERKAIAKRLFGTKLPASTHDDQATDPASNVEDKPIERKLGFNNKLDTLNRPDRPPDSPNKVEGEPTKWRFGAQSKPAMPRRDDWPPEPIGQIYVDGYEIKSAAITPDGKRVIAGLWNGAIEVWNISGGPDKTISRYGHTQNGIREHVFSTHTKEITKVIPFPDSQHCVSTSVDSTLRVWDLNSGKCLTTFYADGAVRSCAVSPDGTLILAGDETGQLHFLRLGH